MVNYKAFAIIKIKDIKKMHEPIRNDIFRKRSGAVIDMQ